MHEIDKAIESGGWETAALHSLENLINQLRDEHKIFQRFSQAEQRGVLEGGRRNAAATIIAARSNRASGASQSGDYFKRECEQGAKQESAIEAWAKEAGCWKTNTAEYLCKVYGQEIAEGGEARVYFSDEQVVKEISLDYFVSPQLALDRITLHNAYFPETRLKVEAFGRDEDGRFRVIASQNFIETSLPPMSQKQIEDYAKSLGFRLVNPRNWTYISNDGRIYLSDLHDENVLQYENGAIFVIDCDIRINTAELRCGGSEILSDEIIDNPMRSGIKH